MDILLVINPINIFFFYDKKTSEARKASKIWSRKIYKLGDSPVSSSIQNRLLKIRWRENATFIGNWASHISNDR